jgi:hypothetical protein
MAAGRARRAARAMRREFMVVAVSIAMQSVGEATVVRRQSRFGCGPKFA